MNHLKTKVVVAGIVDWPKVDNQSMHKGGARPPLEIDSEHLVEGVKHVVAARVGHHLYGERDEQLVARVDETSVLTLDVLHQVSVHATPIAALRHASVAPVLTVQLMLSFVLKYLYMTHQ
jgi:hypothetical protein